MDLETFAILVVAGAIGGWIGMRISRWLKRRKAGKHRTDPSSPASNDWETGVVTPGAPCVGEDGATDGIAGILTGLGVGLLVQQTGVREVLINSVADLYRSWTSQPAEVQSGASPSR